MISPLARRRRCYAPSRRDPAPSRFSTTVTSGIAATIRLYSAALWSTTMIVSAAGSVCARTRVDRGDDLIPNRSPRCRRKSPRRDQGFAYGASHSGPRDWYSWHAQEHPAGHHGHYAEAEQGRHAREKDHAQRAKRHARAWVPHVDGCLTAHVVVWRP